MKEAAGLLRYIELSIHTVLYFLIKAPSRAHVITSPSSSVYRTSSTPHTVLTSYRPHLEHSILDTLTNRIR
jgi:hypothetical protein